MPQSAPRQSQPRPEHQEKITEIPHPMNNQMNVYAEVYEPPSQHNQSDNMEMEHGDRDHHHQGAEQTRTD
jgi:hypothetical protein